jgi:L-fuconolactonase
MSTPNVSLRGHPPEHLVDEAWLALLEEPVVEPDMPIVDAHHHLWDRPTSRYLLPEYLSDARSGHRLLATVYAECSSMYRRDGDPDFASVGEVEFANGVAAMAGSGIYGETRVCAGIVGRVDLRLGKKTGDILEAMLAAAPKRLKGVRQLVAWDPDPSVRGLRNPPPQGVMSDAKFLEGIARLAPLGLSFDIGIYHAQLAEVIALVDRFPDTRFVLNHLGQWIGVGAYQGRFKEEFAIWRRHIAELGRRPNVAMKLGGIGMRNSGFGFLDRDRPPTSTELAEAWSPFVMESIEAFGVARCMFESNFPVDKPTFSYRTLWNTYKRMTAGFSDDERIALFAATANQLYALELDDAIHRSVTARQKECSS